MLHLSDPPPQPLVAPSILAADFGRMVDEVGDVIGKGADLIHVDVMDGHFVDNLTMGPDMVAALHRHFPGVYLDVHLMVERPDRFVDDFAQAGASNFTFQVEVCRPHGKKLGLDKGGVEGDELIEKIHKLGMQAGLAVNPPTPVEHVQPFLDDLDLVLVMSVHPGKGGQKFMPEVLDKARWVSQVVDRHTRVEMDGGLNLDTAPRAVAAGVDVLVAGSALFKARDRAAVIRALHGTTPREGPDPNHRPELN